MRLFKSYVRGALHEMGRQAVRGAVQAERERERQQRAKLRAEQKEAERQLRIHEKRMATDPAYAAEYNEKLRLEGIRAAVIGSTIVWAALTFWLPTFTLVLDDVVAASCATFLVARGGTSDVRNRWVPWTVFVAAVASASGAVARLASVG